MQSGNASAAGVAADEESLLGLPFLYGAKQIRDVKEKTGWRDRLFQPSRPRSAHRRNDRVTGVDAVRFDESWRRTMMKSGRQRRIVQDRLNAC
jgi:hypothetical protein